MKPYKNIRLTAFPDVGDIQQFAAKSVVGRANIINGKVSRPWAKSNDYRGYIKNTNIKRKIRRALKKRDYNLDARLDRRS